MSHSKKIRMIFSCLLCLSLFLQIPTIQSADSSEKQEESLLCPFEKRNELFEEAINMTLTSLIANPEENKKAIQELQKLINLMEFTKDKQERRQLLLDELSSLAHDSYNAGKNLIMFKFFDDNLTSKTAHLSKGVFYGIKTYIDWKCLQHRNDDPNEFLKYTFN